MNIQIKISKNPISYIKAIKYMEKRVNDIKLGKGRDLLWILEHPLTYTAGIRSNKNEILDKKIKVIKTNRGGKITLHDRGQKIIYLVIDLNNKKKDIRKFINFIEKSIIQFLNKYDITAKTDKNNIGIWVKNKKIAAIGLRLSKWITYHGCSINLNNNLNKYKKIIPCGLNNNKVTSLKNETNNKIINVNKNLKEIFLFNISSI
jgi:lipoyl(octanoyl) transferase